MRVVSCVTFDGNPGLPKTNPTSQSGKESVSVRHVADLHGDLGIRLQVDSSDWNGDGWMDVIAGAANGRVRVFLNKGDSGSPRFAEGLDPKLPPIEQPRVLMADLNGDGDEDLFLPSIQGSCFIERSFLKHGYAAAELTAVEQKE